MPNTLFLQSEIYDPYPFYEAMLADDPVYRDEINDTWAVYSYEDCKDILKSTSAHIPGNNPGNRDGLNEYALLISGQLARLSNGLQHELAKLAAMRLFENIKSVPIDQLMECFIRRAGKRQEIDWVGSICKNLPIAVVLKSFDFKEEDCDFITSRIEQLIKLMLPNRTEIQVGSVNTVSKEIYVIVERQVVASGIHEPAIKAISEKYNTGIDKVLSLFVSNLIGLFIQSYDAGRGILSNSMLQILLNKELFPKDLVNRDFLKRAVIETLRFDPPIHNTRRIAVDDIVCKNGLIPRGNSILVVLAAANRDPQKFANPGKYDINRGNNHEHLAFGVGHHACLANHFSVDLAIEALLYFFERYKEVRLLETGIAYERMSNARLPKRMLVSLI